MDKTTKAKDYIACAIEELREVGEEEFDSVIRELEDIQMTRI